MAVNTYSLITLAQAKCYLGISDEDYDSVLTALIDRATGFMERYCGRKFKTRTYTREVYYGTGFPRILLNNYPVTSVGRVSSGRTNAFYIKNTTATNNASIEITATALKYTADGTTVSLTLASYATINLLISALNLVAGWSATLITTAAGTRKATDLLPRPAMYCMSPNVCYGEIPNSELSDYSIIDPGEDVNCGALESSYGWTKGEEYFVDYTAGYATIPYALEEACLLLVAYRYRQKDQDTSLKSESLGDYSYSLRDMKAGIPDDLKSLIDAYRRFVL
jgi:hypothetical protein